MILLSGSVIFPFHLRLFIWESPPRPVLELADCEPPGLAYQKEVVETTLRGGPEGSAAHARAWILKRILETVPEIDPRSNKRKSSDWVTSVVQAKRFTLEHRVSATIKAYHLRYAPHPWWDEEAEPWVRPLVRTSPTKGVSFRPGLVAPGGAGYDPLHPSERALVEAPPCFQDPPAEQVTRELILARKLRGGSKEYLEAVGRDLEKRKERLELICRALEAAHTPSRFDVSERKARGEEATGAEDEDEGEGGDGGLDAAEEAEASPRSPEAAHPDPPGEEAAAEGTPSRRLVWHDGSTVSQNKYFQGPFFQEKPLGSA